MREHTIARETFRIFVVFALIAAVSFGIAQCFDTSTAQAQPVASAEHCVPVYDDAYFCFVDSFVVDAYGDFERAAGAFASLAPWQQRSGFLLTTNDPTRRAIVVYPWDFAAGPMPVHAGSGYVVELFPTIEVAVARLARLGWQERAQVNLVPVFEPGHQAMLIYRRFGVCEVSR